MTDDSPKLVLHRRDPRQGSVQERQTDLPTESESRPSEAGGAQDLGSPAALATFALGSACTLTIVRYRS